MNNIVKTGLAAAFVVASATASFAVDIKRSGYEIGGAQLTPPGIDLNFDGRPMPYAYDGYGSNASPAYGYQEEEGSRGGSFSPYGPRGMW